MLPPLFLDIQPHHRILDMCAAPGSKTTQMCEILHAGSEKPKGFVVANDANLKRCHMLAHQIKRLGFPSFVVTNHNAQAFPGQEESFDRVLCDVPCSGDGTLRKAPDIWRTWQTTGGLGLHKLQLKIALQGARLCAVGGKFAYSTCSMNPVENEAVVGAILKRCDGALELLEVRDALPRLKTRPGLKHWTVMEKSGTFYDEWKDEYSTTLVGHLLEHLKCKATLTRQRGIQRSHFPEPDQPLERCMRIMPHDQNTGAFFVAIFRKVKSIPAYTHGRAEWTRPTSISEEAEATLTAKALAQDSDPGGPTTKTGEIPVEFMPFSSLEQKLSPDTVAKLRAFYQLSDDLANSDLVVRTAGEQGRQFAYVMPQVHQVLSHLVPSGERTKLHIITTGLRALVEDKRLVEYIGRKVEVLPEDAALLIREHQVSAAQLSATLRERLTGVEAGPIIFTVKGLDLALSGYYGNDKANLLIDKNEKKTYQLLFGLSGKEKRTNAEVEGPNEAPAKRIKREPQEQGGVTPSAVQIKVEPADTELEEEAPAKRVKVEAKDTSEVSIKNETE